MFAIPVIRIKVPTINANFSDFITLIHIWQQARSSEDDIEFDFGDCRFLRQNAVAFLGGLKALVESEGRAVHLDARTLQPDVHRNLARNGFLREFGQSVFLSPGNSIPYRRDMNPGRNQLMEFMIKDWLGRGWVQVSTNLALTIAGRMWEVYENAFEHSRSNVGVFSCGQHYPKLEQLQLTVVDFGVGIVENVRNYMEVHSLNAGTALEWAFRRGTTTRPLGVSGGLGLDILREFVRVNRGTIQIFSNDGYGRIDHRSVNFRGYESSFNGTIVNISLQCDDSVYVLASELQDKPLF